MIKPKPKHYKAEEDKWADFKKVRELMSSFKVLFIDESGEASILS